MGKSKVILIWVLGIIITISAAVFQRLTGPTNPFKTEITLGGESIKLNLPRSLETVENKDDLLIKVNKSNLKGTIYHRIYPSSEQFIIDTLLQTENGLMAKIPAQKAAGKIVYKTVLTDGKDIYTSPLLVARYKDPVPAGFLVPHILLMFASMLLAVVAGLKAAFNMNNYSRLLLLSGMFLFIGGFIFGAIVQKYAFGVFWSGVPFGWDLTDNKTLLVAIFFAYAIWKNRKQPSRKWTLIAVIVLLLVYSIPHSLFGSELDHKTGELAMSETSKMAGQ